MEVHLYWAYSVCAICSFELFLLLSLLILIYPYLSIHIVNTFFLFAYFRIFILKFKHWRIVKVKVFDLLNILDASVILTGTLSKKNPLKLQTALSCTERKKWYVIKTSYRNSHLSHLLWIVLWFVGSLLHFQ